MSRFVNPVPQYKPSSKLFFFKSGTNSQLTTFKDQFETIPNTHPVLTDSAGFVPNIFFSGSAKLLVTDEDDVQYIDRDPVGGEKELGDFTLWDTLVTYNKNDIVEGSDGRFYQSLIMGNQGNDPITSPEEWSQIRFIVVYNEFQTYSTGEIVQTLDGILWASQSNDNIANDPATDDGTNWFKLSVDDWGDPITSSFTTSPGLKQQIEALISNVDITMPVTLIQGQEFTHHNSSASTKAVLIKNPNFTIRGPSGIIDPGTDLEIEPGDTSHLVAISSTILEAV